MEADTHAREAAFHDELAAREGVQPPREPNWWERAILDALPPLEGKKVLDLGCGDGEITMQLVDRGAQVTALDVSPGMVDLARRRVEEFRPNATVEFLTAPAEQVPRPDGSFDVIVGKWVLHHLDLERGVRELTRLLRPGGIGIFLETSALNPMLALGRRYVVAKGRLGTRRYGTLDERPLGRRELRAIRGEFRASRVDFPVFFLFHIFDRNVLRFRWKKLTPRLIALDQAIGRRARALGPLSYYLRLVVEK